MVLIEEESENIPPSQTALGKADELITRGLKIATEAPKQTPAEIWAEFDTMCTHLQEAAKD